MAHDAYLDPYRQSHARHGTDFDVTLWASRTSQELRFRVFTEMCVLAGKRVLDAGCSRGDLADYLLRHEIQFARYIGIDGLTAVIDFARQRGLPDCEFHAADFVTQPQSLTTGDPQVICISGALNTMADAQVQQALDAAWKAAGHTLMFNFLSDRCGKLATGQSYPARRLDALHLLDWALRQTSQVAYRQDYFKHGHDATIVMHKE
ncbi:MAG: class I SAM-dependent methyltransferase [Phycisphaeraceae bacterium]